MILDWVPAHFPRDEFALARFDGTALYEHADPRRGAHPDWGTLVFNYGRHEVRNFLISNALFWLREYHVDGIRVDAVASMLYLDYSRREGEWVPNQFGGREDLDAVVVPQGAQRGHLRARAGRASPPPRSRPRGRASRGPPTWAAWASASSGTWAGCTTRCGYFQQDPIYRRYHHHELTFSLMYAFSENFILPLSHDEVVHGKGSLYRRWPGDRWQKLANLRALYAYMWAHPGKKLLFMGCELAQEAEWSHERSLDWHLLEHPEHAGIQSLVRDLNRLYRDEPALWEIDSDPSGFWWLEPNDADAQRARVRARSRPKDGERVVVFVGQPLAGAARGLPPRAAARGALARGAQHRLDVLRRQRRRQPRRRRARADPLARPAVLGRGHAAAARGGVVRAGIAVSLTLSAPVEFGAAEYPWERPLGARPRSTAPPSSACGRRAPSRSRCGSAGATSRWPTPATGSTRRSPRPRRATTTCTCVDGADAARPALALAARGLRGPVARRRARRRPTARFAGARDRASS